MKLLSKISNASYLGIGFFFLIIYLCFFPTNILIFDEWQYFQQGLAYSQGSPLLYDINPISGINESREPGSYPIGNPFFLAGLIFLFGKKAVFLQGIISLLGAFFFTAKTLKNLQLNPHFALLLFIFFPASFLARTLMSDLPSLLMVSWFLYLFTKNHRSTFHIFGAGGIMGIAILFREPNILLMLPFLLGLFFRKKIRTGIYGMIGFTIAIGIKLLGTYWAFGDPFFTKDPGISFSIKFFLQNLVFYSPFLFIFIPGGGWAVFKYRGKFQNEIKIALILFIGLYLLYGYNGTNISGLKSVVLGPRFLIPALPLFAICLAKMCETKFQLIKKILLPLSILSILGTQLVGYYYNSAQQEAFSGLENKKGKIHFIEEVNSTPKIFFPNSDGFNLIYPMDSLLISQIISKDTFMYVETSIRRDNKLAYQYVNNLNASLDGLFKNYKREEIFQYTLPDNITIVQFKISEP